jgi:hypothetical protein
MLEMRPDTEARILRDLPWTIPEKAPMPVEFERWLFVDLKSLNDMSYDYYNYPPVSGTLEEMRVVSRNNELVTQVANVMRRATVPSNQPVAVNRFGVVGRQLQFAHALGCSIQARSVFLQVRQKSINRVELSSVYLTVC